MSTNEDAEGNEPAAPSSTKSTTPPLKKISVEGKPQVRPDILVRLRELGEFHGDTLPLPLVFDVFFEFNIEKSKAKGILGEMEKAGYIRLNSMRSITLLGT